MTRHLFILIYLFYMISQANAESRFVELGDSKSTNCWVYLCGLAESFDSPDERKHRQILNDIGRELNIRFIALIPRNRCPKFDNKICWPHKDPEQASETYQSIISDLAGIRVNGWIGFSNGGYFLHEISQQNVITNPVVTIGSPGSLTSTDQIYVMIGRGDTYAHEKSKDLNYKIIEYEGGHEIDSGSLKKVLESILILPSS